MTSNGLARDDVETIAAFLDRRLSEVERQAFLERLDRDQALYEVFVETVRYREQEEATIAPVVEHPSARPSRSVAVPAAAAALIAAAVVTPFLLRSAIDLSTGRLSQQLTANRSFYDRVEDQWYAQWDTFRGITGEQGIDDTAFRVGVRMVDLTVALRLGSDDDSRLLTGEIDHLLADSRYGDIRLLLDVDVRSLLDEGGQTDQLLLRVQEIDTALGEFFGDTPPAYALGKWTEAGRLAVTSDNRGLLEGRHFRRSLSGFRDRPWSEEVARQLEEIARLLAVPRSQVDYGALESSFKAILRSSQPVLL